MKILTSIIFKKTLVFKKIRYQSLKKELKKKVIREKFNIDPLNWRHVIHKNLYGRKLSLMQLRKIQTVYVCILYGRKMQT
jgi:hypothetical protein